jgi:hypothetical protein
MNDPLSLAGAEQWLDEWTSSVADSAAQARRMADRAAKLTATATNTDGSVEVTVGSGGSITDLRLDDLVRRWPTEQISSEILSTIREAQRNLSRKMTTVVEETVGTNTATGQAILAGLRERTEGGDRGGR